MLSFFRGIWVSQILTGFTAASLLLHAFLVYILQFSVIGSHAAEAPEWWQDREVIKEGAKLDNGATVNIGQLKWISSRFYEELESLLPIAVNFQLMGEGGRFQEALLPYEAGYQDSLGNNSLLAVLGQAKAIALPFYDQLNAISPEWVKAQLVESGMDPDELERSYKSENGYYYPWTVDRADDSNNAPLNIGQLKLLFSMRARADNEADPDGLPDLFEHALIALSDEEYAAYTGEVGAMNPFSNLTDLSKITSKSGRTEVAYVDTDGNVVNTGASAPQVGAAVDDSEVLSLLSEHESVGSLGGGFNVSGDGSSSYSIPVKLPRGSGGLTPEVSLSYSSNSDLGLVGLGFNIGGLQSITRGRGDRVKDGYIAEEYTPLFGPEDRYYLNGQLLIGTEDKEGNTLGRDRESSITYVKGDGVTYHTEKESFVEVKGQGVQGEWGPSHFTMRTTSGMIYEFENCTTSCMSDPNAHSVMVWMLNKVTDLNGNYYIIEYDRDVLDSSKEAYTVRSGPHKRSQVRIEKSDCSLVIKTLKNRQT